MSSLQTDATSAPRDPLSRQRVLEAAVALADEAGLGALTMRGLAQELGVEAMTLYYHVENKADILNGIVDLVLREVESPPADWHWKAALRRSAISAHDVLVRHPWAAGLMISTETASPARLEQMDAILRTFRQAGFSAELTDRAYHALESHITGFTLWQVGMNLGSDEDIRALAADFLRDFPREEMPHLAEHIEWHLRPPDPADEGTFAFGLDLILDGLERMLEGDAEASRPG
jgi:AcrR family transcriptional regulator